MAGAPEKPAALEWAHTLMQGGAVPLADSPDCSHGWASPPGTNFFVRGPHFLETKAKVPGGEPFLQPIAFDLIKSSSKIFRIMEHPKCRVRAALCAARESAKPPAPTNGETDGEGVAQEPFVWVFNLLLPTKENHSLVMYYVSFRSPEKGSLIQKFLDGDDAFRNERLKMVTSIPQAPRLVKLVVSERGSVCMMGKVLNCTYTRGKDYMEVDMDIGSSMLASAAYHVCGGLAAFVTAEFAFVFEGRCPDELPERIVGAIRLVNLDLSSATFHECPLLSQESVSKDIHEASYKRVWKSLSKLAQAGHRDVRADDV